MIQKENVHHLQILSQGLNIGLASAVQSVRYLRKIVAVTGFPESNHVLAAVNNGRSAVVVHKNAMDLVLRVKNIWINWNIIEQGNVQASSRRNPFVRYRADKNTVKIAENERREQRTGNNGKITEPSIQQIRVACLASSVNPHTAKGFISILQGNGGSSFDVAQQRLDYRIQSRDGKWSRENFWSKVLRKFKKEPNTIPPPQTLDLKGVIGTLGGIFANTLQSEGEKQRKHWVEFIALMSPVLTGSIVSGVQGRAVEWLGQVNQNKDRDCLASIFGQKPSDIGKILNEINTKGGNRAEKAHIRLSLYFLAVIYKAFMMADTLENKDLYQKSMAYNLIKMLGNVVSIADNQGIRSPCYGVVCTTLAMMIGEKTTYCALSQNEISENKGKLLACCEKIWKDLCLCADTFEMLVAHVNQVIQVSVGPRFELTTPEVVQLVSRIYASLIYPDTRVPFTYHSPIRFLETLRIEQPQTGFFPAKGRQPVPGHLTGGSVVALAAKLPVVSSGVTSHRPRAGRVAPGAKDSYTARQKEQMIEYEVKMSAIRVLKHRARADARFKDRYIAAAKSLEAKNQLLLEEQQLESAENVGHYYTKLVRAEVMPLEEVPGDFKGPVCSNVACENALTECRKILGIKNENRALLIELIRSKMEVYDKTQVEGVARVLVRINHELQKFQTADSDFQGLKQELNDLVSRINLAPSVHDQYYYPFIQPMQVYNWRDNITLLIADLKKANTGGCKGTKPKVLRTGGATSFIDRLTKLVETDGFPDQDTLISLIRDVVGEIAKKQGASQDDGPKVRIYTTLSKILHAMGNRQEQQAVAGIVESNIHKRELYEILIKHGHLASGIIAKGNNAILVKEALLTLAGQYRPLDETWMVIVEKIEALSKCAAGIKILTELGLPNDATLGRLWVAYKGLTRKQKNTFKERPPEHEFVDYRAEKHIMPGCIHRMLLCAMELHERKALKGGAALVAAKKAMAYVESVARVQSRNEDGEIEHHSPLYKRLCEMVVAQGEQLSRVENLPGTDNVLSQGSGYMFGSRIHYILSSLNRLVIKNTLTHNLFEEFRAAHSTIGLAKRVSSHGFGKRHKEVKSQLIGVRNAVQEAIPYTEDHATYGVNFSFLPPGDVDWFGNRVDPFDGSHGQLLFKYQNSTGDLLIGLEGSEMKGVSALSGGNHDFHSTIKIIAGTGYFKQGEHNVFPLGALNVNRIKVGLSNSRGLDVTRYGSSGLTFKVYKIVLPTPPSAVPPPVVLQALQPLRDSDAGARPLTNGNGPERPDHQEEEVGVSGACFVHKSQRSGGSNWLSKQITLYKNQKGISSNRPEDDPYDGDWTITEEEDSELGDSPYKLRVFSTNDWSEFDLKQGVGTSGQQYVQLVIKRGVGGEESQRFESLEKLLEMLSKEDGENPFARENIILRRPLAITISDSLNMSLGRMESPLRFSAASRTGKKRPPLSQIVFSEKTGSVGAPIPGVIIDGEKDDGSLNQVFDI